MRITSQLFIAAFTLLVLATTAHSLTPREQLNQMVQQLQKTPNDSALREKIIKFARTIKPAPAIPAEAERHDGRAQYAFRGAKSEAEMLDAAREYVKAVDAAPWVADYYFNLCAILEKANRPAQAMRACKFYLAAGPAAPDASAVRKRIAGLEYALERLRGNVTQRRECEGNVADMYERGGKLALIGSKKISVKLISPLYSGVFRNQLLITDVTSMASHRFELEPIDRTFRVDDRQEGSPYVRLTITSDGRITFGGHGSTQAEIVTSVEELHQLRNAQLSNCPVATKDGRFFVRLGQGGPARSSRDGALVGGWLFFESDCAGNLIGGKPGWFPTLFVGADRHIDMEGFGLASADACLKSSTDGLRWLTP